MTREEQITEIAKEYYNPKSDTPYSLQMRVGFVEGANWADKTMVEKMCVWLETIDFEMEYMNSSDGYTFFNKEKGCFKANFQK